MLTQKGKVSLSTLGSNGRFGNQIFQYAFLRIYAKHYFNSNKNVNTSSNVALIVIVPNRIIKIA